MVEMKPSTTLDAVFATVIALVVLSIVMVKGDALYIGLWYYFAVPIVILGIGGALRTKPMFLFGTSLAIAITFIFYMSINWSASHPEGLLGLGHLFSLPGAVVGVFIAATLLKHKATASLFIAFLFGFIGLLGGFFINQLAVCNTVFYCGQLSFFLE
jgi:hypothetical protein